MSRGVECRHVTVVRPGPGGRERTILDDVCATFEPMAISLITGAVGSGKSTLLHVMSTLMRPTSGDVLAGGEPVSRFAGAHRARWRRQAGISTQTPHFIADLSALENVMVPLIPTGVSMDESVAVAMRQLERLEVRDLAHRKTSELSGGERARVALARALVARPRFLFIDEPTAHQDAEAAQLILSVLASERARGAVVLVVSHDPSLGVSEEVDHLFELRLGALEAVR